MSDKIQLDLPVLLPDVPDARDACVRRLIGSLTGHDGVEQAHIVEAADGMPDLLCIHYDSKVLTLPRIRQMAQRLGAELTDHIGHVVWKIEGLRHLRRARRVAERMRRIAGVVEAEATATGLLRVEFNRDLAIEAALRAVLRGA